MRALSSTLIEHFSQVCLLSCFFHTEALLAAYLVYRAKCKLPDEVPSHRGPLAVRSWNSSHCPLIGLPESSPIFGQEDESLVARILHRNNPFLRMEGQSLTFLQACKGSFLHPVSKHSGNLGMESMKCSYRLLAS